MRRKGHEFEPGNLVYAVRDLAASTSADIALFVVGPASYNIPKGTPGLFVGPAFGEPELLVVEFEHGGNSMVRVEVDPSDLRGE